MKNFDEVMNFFRVAIATGSGIAKDHGAREVSVHYGYRIDDLPPSIASGVGQITESLTFLVAVSFEPSRRPVTRSRKFTIYSQEGPDVWPSGNMTVSDTKCFFELQVGNVTNQGWGIFASWRNNNLDRVTQQIRNLVQQSSLGLVQPHSSLPVQAVTSHDW